MVTYNYAFTMLDGTTFAVEGVTQRISQRGEFFYIKHDKVRQFMRFDKVESYTETKVVEESPHNPFVGE